VANSIYHGKGPTLNYVGSFFRQYPRWGLVDDWSLPLYSYYLAFAFTLGGNSVAVAKAATFFINLCTIPQLFWLAKRSYGPPIAVASALTLAVFPPHVLYASFMLKESLSMFCTVLAVSAFLWAWQARRILLPCLVAGLAAGAMGLTRNTCHAVLAVMILFALLTPTPARWIRLAVWAAVVFFVLLPWGVVTYRDYGTPFYTYTDYFRYTPDWTVHFRNRGVPTLRDYLSQPLWTILHTKCVLLYLIIVHCWFVFTPILCLGYFAGFRAKWRHPLSRLSLLMFIAFLAGTLVNIASVDQVRDFGRYFPVVLLPMIPVALGTVITFCERWRTVLDERHSDEISVDHDDRARRQLHYTHFARVLLAVLLVSCFWGAYAWTRNYSWLSDPWHQQLIGYQRVGNIVRKKLPADAIIMAYHPWELHMYSDRRTVLMPHNLDPRRLRQEVDTYAVTHIVLSRGMGQALQPIVKEFAISLDDDFTRNGIGVYPVRR
jgi:4-amino-4-deoxy-L-arabinose transferase-like glycosyltransferase